MLKAVRRHDATIDVTLIAFWQPWVVRRFASELSRMRAELARSGITQLDYVNAYVPSRHFLYRVSLFPILHGWAKVIFRKALAARYDVVHARSYFAAYVAAELKRTFGHKLIFDMRSLFPLEHVTVGTWRPGDRGYRKWRRIEAWTVANSEAVVGVSPGMIDEIRRVDSHANAALIPIAVDTAHLRFDALARTRIREERGWGHRLVVTYQGSLGRGYLWNNIENYAPYFRRILDVRPDAHFLILTPDTNIGVEEVLTAWGIGQDHFTVTEAGGADLPRWLAAADFGMHVMAPGPDSHTRLGVKVTEYLSCGLPILVNSNVGAAAALAREHGVGAVIDLEDPGAEVALKAFVNSDFAAMRERCRRLAEAQFSVERCGARYADLYRMAIVAPAPAACL